MIDWQKSVLMQNATLQEVVLNVNETSTRIVLMVNDKMKYVGIVVDGDIRRGLLTGDDLSDPVTQIVN